jgi:hypothetical protein
MRVFADVDAILALLLRECQIEKFNGPDSLMTIGSVSRFPAFTIEFIANYAEFTTVRSLKCLKKTQIA